MCYWRSNCCNKCRRCNLTYSWYLRNIWRCWWLAHMGLSWRINWSILWYCLNLWNNLVYCWLNNRVCITWRFAFNFILQFQIFLKFTFNFCIIRIWLTTCTYIYKHLVLCQLHKTFLWRKSIIFYLNKSFILCLFVL